MSGGRGRRGSSRFRSSKHAVDAGSVARNDLCYFRMPKPLPQTDGPVRVSMDAVFRAVKPSDIEGLFSVRARTRENALSKEQLASIEVTVESLADDLGSGRVMGWVCLHESNLVGFCLGDVTKAEVLVLAVLPEYESRGIGTRLLSLVVNRLRSTGCHTIWLAASADSRVRAHGFYRSLGWRPNGQKHAGGDEILVLEAHRISR